MENKGFTLIELLIVIAIATIIAGAMLPLFTVTKADAREAKIKAELDTIKTAAINLRFDTEGNGLSEKNQGEQAAEA